MNREELIEKFKDYVHGYVGSSMLTNTEYPEQIVKQANACADIAQEYAQQKEMEAFELCRQFVVTMSEQVCLGAIDDMLKDLPNKKEYANRTIK